MSDITSASDSLAAGLTPRERKTPVLMGTLAMATDAILSVFANLRVGERLSAAEARLQALEAMSLPHYEGTFEAGKMYRQGSLCTRSGSLWLAVEATDRTPGAAASGWKLIVKSGSA